MGCKSIKRNMRRVCVGDLNKLITLQARAISPPSFSSTDFDETFTNGDDVWAAVNTVAGKTFFDGVNTDITITHEIFIRFDASVTSETWIEMDDRRIDILDTENLDERDEWLKLICTERGPDNVEATKA
jgi:SPP1 family predicted phage head-tail adaptor